MTKKDPIFALIEAHNAAEVAHQKTSNALSDLEDRIQGEDDKIYPAGKAHWARRTTKEAAIGAGTVFITSVEGIDAYIRTERRGLFHLPPKAKKAAEEALTVLRNELVEKLKAARKEKARARRACGLAPLAAAYERTDRLASVATRKMCETKPTTLAGLTAMLILVRDAYADGLSWDYYDNRTANVFKTLAAASRRLAKADAGQGAGKQSATRAPLLRLVG